MKFTAKLLVPILAVSLSQIARALTFNSVAPGGNWSDPLAWDHGTLVPDTFAGDVANIVAGTAINFDDIGFNTGPLTTGISPLTGTAGGLAVADGGVIFIDGGALTQTTLTIEVRIGEGSGGSGVGTLTIDNAGTFNSGAALAVAVGTSLTASLGSGTVNINAGSFTVGAGAAGVGFGMGVGVDGSTGVVNVGDAVGVANTAVLNLGNATLGIGIKFGTAVGGSGTVTVSSDGRINQGTGNILIGNGGATTASLTVNGGSVIGSGGKIIVGEGLGTIGTLLLQNGGTINGTGELRVGSSDGTGGGTGTLTMTGGTLTMTNEFTAGRGAGTSGTVAISGASTVTTNSIFVGREGGTGSMGVSGGTTTANGQLFVGTNGGSIGTLTISNAGTVVAVTDFTKIGNDNGTGTLTMSGGALNTTNYMTVGQDGGVGTVNQTGGTVTFSQWAAIGVGGGANTSKWDISGGNITSGAGIEVGADRGGEMNISGTANVAVGSVILGTRTNGNGLVNKTGGTLVTNNLGIAGAQSGGAFGTFNLSGGAGSVTTINGGGGQSYIGNNTGSVGTLNIQGAGTVLNNVSGQDHQIGFNGGTGNLNITAGGRMNHNWWINVARGGTSTGNITVAGAGSTLTQTAGQLNVGEDGTGTLDVTNGGTLNTADEFSIGRNGGSNGAVTLAGAASTMNLLGHLFVGRSGTGTFTQTAGTLNLNGRRIQIGENGGSTGTFNITAGTVNNSEWMHVGSGAGSTGNLNVNFTNPAAVITTGALYVGNNSATGFATVLQGSLRANGVVEIGRHGNGQGTLTVTGPNSSVHAFTGGGGDFFRVGMASGDGIVNVTAGGKINANAGWFTLGENDGSNGTATFSGTGSSLTANGLIVGWNGAAVGTLNISSNATVTSTGREVSIGRDNANTQGTININSGGVLTGNDFRIGHNGIGLINMNNGTINATGWTILGSDGGNSSGTVNMTAASAFNVNGGRVYIGRHGTGTMTLSNGSTFTHINSDQFIVGGHNDANFASVGTLTVDATSSVSTTNFIRVGHGNAGANPAVGVVNLNGGTIAAGNWMGMGHEGGSGTLNMTGGAITYNNEFYVGIDDNGHSRQTTGVANISGGSIVQTGGGAGVFIGRNGGVGVLNVTGATPVTISTNNSFVVGEGGIGSGGGQTTGTVNITNPNATVTVGNQFQVGLNSGVGTYTQNAGSLVTNGGGNDGNWVGRNGAQGTLNVTSGTVQMAGGLNIGAGNNGVVGSTGTVNITNAFVNVNGWTTMGRDTGGFATSSTLNIGTGATYNHQTGDNGDFLIGWQNGSTAAVNVSNGGTVNYSWWTRVGVDGGSNGSVLLNNGANWNQTGGRVFIGEKATGSLTITNNSKFTHTNSNDIFIVGGGQDNNNVGQGTLTIDATSRLETSRGLEIGKGRNGGVSSTGTANVTGGIIRAVTGGGGDFFKIGTRGGVGVLNVTSGGTVTTNAGWFALGENDNSVGNATFSGTGTTLTSTGLIVGWNGSAAGTLNISNNAVVNNSGHEVSIGRDNSNTTGTINITSGGILNAGRDLRVANNGIGTVNINSGTLNSAGGWAIIGDGGTAVGVVNMTNGTFNHPNDSLFLGANPGAQGTFTQAGNSTTNIGGELNLGKSGSTGVVNVNGGTFNVNGWTNTGRDGGGGTGTINVTNGGLFTHLQTSGDGLFGWTNGNTGNVNVSSGGRMVYNWWVRLGVDGGSTGNMTVSGTGSRFDQGTVQGDFRFLVGESGTGNLQVLNGGTVAVGNGLTVGGNPNEGDTGTGNVTVTNGTVITAGEVNLGFNNGATGNLTVNSGRMTNRSYFVVGRSGTGTFIQNGGSVNNTNDQLRIGNDASGVGTFTMNGGIYTSYSHGMIGEAGNGTLNLLGGAISIGCGAGGNLFIGRLNGSNGLMNMTGGLLRTDGGFVEFNSQGGAVTSTLNLNGGILATNYLDDPTGSLTALINVNGGTLRAMSDEGNFIRGFTTAQVTLNGAGLTVDTDNRTVSINMALGGAGGITKTGLGQLNLTTTQANTGATRVNAGVLNLDFSAVANTANLVANSGLTLAGGTLRVNGSNAGAEAQTFTGTSLLSGASAVTVVENGGGAVSINLNAITRSAGSTVNFALPTVGVIATTNANDAGGLLNGAATVGDIWASVAAGNIAAYAGAFTAGFGATNNFDTTASAGSVTAGGSVHSIRFSNAGADTITLNANSTVNSGGILVAGSVGANNVTIAPTAAETLTSLAADLIVIQNNTAGDLIIGAQVDGAVALTKSGVGELILTNAGNSYTGGTFINAGTVTIGADGALGAAAGGVTFAATSLASGGVLHTTANMTLGAGRAVTLNSGGGGFDVDNLMTLTIGQGITGKGGLGKLGAGTLNLQGANSYTGATAIYGGTLIMTGSLTGTSGLLVNGLLSVPAGGSIGSAGEIHIAQGGPSGTLDVSGVGASVTGSDVIIGENGGGTGTANITLGGTLTAECRLYVGRFSGSNGLLNVTAGSVVNGNEWVVIGDQGGSNGAVNLAGNAILNVAAQLRVGDAGTGSLTLNGSSLVDLLSPGANHYIGVGGGSSGTLTVNGGKVNFATGAVVEAGWGGGSTGNLIQSGGEIAGNPAIVIGRDGIGNANISGGTTTYRSFEIGNNAGSSTGTVTLSGTANVVGAASVYVGRNSGNATLNLNGGTLTTNSIIHEGGGTSQLNFNGTTIKPNADNTNFINNFSAATTDVQAGGAIFDTNGKNIKVTTDLDGVGLLQKDGAGTLTLNGNSSYAGGVNLNTGTISVRHNNALGTGTVIGNGGRLSFDNSGGAGLLEGRVTYGTNGFDTTSAIPGDTIRLSTPRGNSTDTGAFGDNSTWGYRGLLVVPAGGATWSFAEQFDDNVLLKIDGVTLLNDTSWNNPTQATVALAAGEHTIEVRFGQGGGGVGPNSGWNIGFGIDYTGAGTTNPANYVALTDPGDGSRLKYSDEGFIDYTVANAAVLNVMTEVFVKQFGANLTGNISGAGGLNKTGDGRLTITGTNSYGTTNIAAGILEVGSGGATGTLGAGAVTNATLLKFNRSGILNVPNVISGIGAIQQNGPGTTVLSGVSTYTGTTTLNAGKLNVGSAETPGVSGPLGTSAAANPGSIVFAGGTLQYSAANQNDYSGRFSTAASQAYRVDTNSQNVTWATALTSVGGSLNKSGNGTLFLSNALNSYNGGTVIDGGTLKISANAALGALAGGVAINNDAILQAAANVTTNRTVTLGTGGGQIDANGQTVTLDTLSTLTGTALTTDDTAGGGVVNIKGVQTYNALTTEGAGVTNIYTALGTGTSTITANATLNIYVSQTLASLDIGAGTEVTFGDGLPFTSLPPAKFGGGAAGVVPEPGSLGLLLVGALGFIARRRRSC